MDVLLIAAAPTVDERPGEAEDGWCWASTPYVPNPAAQQADELPPIVSVLIQPYSFTEQGIVTDVRISSRWALWQYGFAGDRRVIAPPIHRRLGSARGVAASGGRP